MIVAGPSDVVCTDTSGLSSESRFNSGWPDSIFKTCDMGDVSGDFCFVHTNTTKMAAIITEIVK